MALDPALLGTIRRMALENASGHGGHAAAGPLLSKVLGTNPELRGRSAEVRSAIDAVVSEVAALSLDAQRAELERLGGPIRSSPREAKGREEGALPELPDAIDGKVVLRLAPFPSGALHIGNARMLYVNDYYRRLHHGRLLLVFDDTVGSQEKRIAPELFDVIRHDLDIAGVPPDEVLYKSDRLPTVYRWARRVIDAGGAYVCTCPAETLQANRAKGTACPERSQPGGETADLWQKMLDGGFAPGEAVLRLRTDLADPDPAFRDRVLCRLSDLDHPRVGRRWRVWPMLEFSWAVDDIELGITHVLRGKDLVMEDRMEAFVWKLLGERGPPFLHWGLLRVAEAKISKSKGYQQVRSGEYDGWADPRLWSIDSLDRRGIEPEALRRFTLGFGLSLADIEVPAETLYAENRQLIDPTTPRRSAVIDAREVEVADYPPELARTELPNHPDRPELGRRSVPAGPRFLLAGSDLAAHPGGEIRLKDLVNIELPSPLPVSGPVPARFTSRENRKLPRVQWVGASGAVPVSLLDPDGTHRIGLGEAALAEATPRQVFQFERIGFVRVETDQVPGVSPLRVCFGHP